jgi:hypothetical protein
VADAVPVVEADPVPVSEADDVPVGEADDVTAGERNGKVGETEADGSCGDMEMDKREAAKGKASMRETAAEALSVAPKYAVNVAV